MERREFMRTAAVVGAVGWTAPIVRTTRLGQTAGSPPPVDPPAPKVESVPGDAAPKRGVSGGTLPFTGADVRTPAAVASVAIAAGVALQRYGREPEVRR